MKTLTLSEGINIDVEKTLKFLIDELEEECRTCQVFS